MTYAADRTYMCCYVRDGFKVCRCSANCSQRC